MGNDWLLVRDIYSDLTTSIKWESHLLAPFVKVFVREELCQRPKQKVQ